MLLAGCAPGMQVRLASNSFTVLPKILQIISVDTITVVHVVEQLLMDLDNEHVIQLVNVAGGSD